MIEVRFSARKNISLRHSREPIEPSNGYLQLLSRGQSGRGVKVTTQLHLPQRLRISRILPLLHRNNVVGILSRLCTGRTRNGGLLPGGDKRVTTDSGGSCASCLMVIGRQFPGSRGMYRNKITEEQTVLHFQTFRMIPHNFRI
jgi:hypothetical protein